MRAKLFCTSLLFIGMAVTIACGGGDGGRGTGPQPPSASGTWLGNAVTDWGADRWMTLTLQETDQAISGSCAITVAIGEPPYWTGTVSGSHVHPDISLTITEPGFAPLSLVGSLANANTFNVTLSGTAGWTNTQVTFRRQ